MNIYHRYFVQYMIKNGVAPIDKALDFCRHISKGKIETLTHLKIFIIEINREISQQFYKIVINICEVTNQNVVVWLNTKNDDISKHQIAFSALELEYFQAILQQILESDDYRITFIVCINITSTLTSYYSRDSGQKVLDKWLKGGYYVNHGEFIYLGPRTILEFTSYLRSNCPDCICDLCSELVFTGRQCSVCYKKLHSYCLVKYLLNQNECPCCKQIWSDLGGEGQYNGTHIDQYVNIDESTEMEAETVADPMASPSTSEPDIFSPIIGHSDRYETPLASSTQRSDRISPILRDNSRRNRMSEGSEQSCDDSVKPGPSRRKRQR